MSEPKFPKFPVQISPDGKTAEIQCWFVNKPFTCDELLRQIHIVNPDVSLKDVIFYPGMCCFYITLPNRQIAEPS